jgi:hypothetical protein
VGGFRFSLGVCLLFTTLVLGRVAFAQEDFVHWRGVGRFSYESVDLSQNERMDLAGFHYLVDVSPRWYAGLGVFSAVVGNRGGFFMGGFDAGVRQPVAGNLFLDAGLFLGGGGGSNSPQGGGLMVRPQLGLLYDADEVRLALAYALIDFPNGNIRSKHPVFFLDVPFDTLLLPSNRPDDLVHILDRASGSSSRVFVLRQAHLAARYTVYSPPGAILSRSGRSNTGTIQTTGVEYDRDLNTWTYLFAEASGASGGRSDGYAEFFFGGGCRLPVYDRRLYLDGRISAGAAGGGNVDTGGGGSGKASLGLKVAVADGLSVDTRAGYQFSAGPFRAKIVEFGLSYALDTAGLGARGSVPALSPDELRVDSWRIRFSLQQYVSLRPFMRKNGRNSVVSLLGTKLDKRMGSGPFYLTGQAQSAFAGGAGGYSVGLMGAGYLSGPLAGTGFRVFAEALGGAAGGGGIKVGGGGVVQPLAGVIYDLTNNAGVEASIGRIKAIHGSLDSTVAEAGFVYRFSTLGAAPRNRPSTRLSSVY